MPPILGFFFNRIFAQKLLQGLFQINRVNWPHLTEPNCSIETLKLSALLEKPKKYIHLCRNLQHSVLIRGRRQMKLCVALVHLLICLCNLVVMFTAVYRSIASTATVFIATNDITCPLLGSEANDVLYNHNSEDVWLHWVAHGPQ